MKKNSIVRNLSVGWVVKANVISPHLTPGCEPIRKIIYCDYKKYGYDLLYKNNELPIIYPIVSFKEQEENKVENGEYVIMPWTTITTYLGAFKINTIGELSSYNKDKIKNLIFNNSYDVTKPIYLRKNVNLEIYNQEVKRLHDFKICDGPIIPTSTEYKYLNSLMTSDNSYQKTL